MKIESEKKLLWVEMMLLKDRVPIRERDIEEKIITQKISRVVSPPYFRQCVRSLILTVTL